MKRFLIFIGGLFLLVAIVNSILYLWQWRPANESRRISPPPAINSSETKVIQNEFLGISVAVLAPFQLTLDTSAQSEIIRMMAPREGEDAKAKLEIISFENVQNLPILEWAGQYAQNRDAPAAQFLSRTVGDEPALYEEKIEARSSSQTTFVARASKIYVINVFFPDRNDMAQYQRAVDATIQSITFLSNDK